MVDCGPEIAVDDKLFDIQGDKVGEWTDQDSLFLENIVSGTGSFGALDPVGHARWQCWMRRHLRWEGSRVHKLVLSSCSIFAIGTVCVVGELLPELAGDVFIGVQLR